MRHYRVEDDVQLDWVNRGLVVATINGRKIHIGGEALLAGDPDYVVYAGVITSWADGSPLTEEEKADILDEVVEEARRRGWKFEVEW
jgi:hypothetical protein